MTAYNWETNDSNAGADYHNQNDNFLGGGSTPNGAVKPGLEAARNAGAGMIVTMPIIGYVAADHNGGGDVAPAAPNYLQTCASTRARRARAAPSRSRPTPPTPSSTRTSTSISSTRPTRAHSPTRAHPS